MIKDTIKKYTPEIIKWRRHFHAHPERGMQEWGTADYVTKVLHEHNIDVQRFENMPAIVATLKGGKPGKVVALRADMDALPMQEEADVSFKSTVDGVMHSCGHDIHTAVLLGAAVVLAAHREEVPGTVRFLFQPAEEGPGGAFPMVEAGAMDGVDYVFGQHVFPIGLPGQFSVKQGVASSNSDSAVITIIGKGGHGASPDKAVDPVLVAMYVGLGLQSIVSRNVSPMDSAVVSIGSINSGTVANIIPSSATMKLSIRSFSAETQQLLHERIVGITEGICQAMGATSEIEYKFGYPMMINNQQTTDYLIDVLGPENVLVVDQALSGSEGLLLLPAKSPRYILRSMCRLPRS